LSTFAPENMSARSLSSFDVVLNTVVTGDEWLHKRNESLLSVIRPCVRPKRAFGGASAFRSSALFRYEKRPGRVLFGRCVSSVGERVTVSRVAAAELSRCGKAERKAASTFAGSPYGERPRNAGDKVYTDLLLVRLRMSCVLSEK
jgi:hypothetical protein